MTTTNLDLFQRELRETGGYATAPARRAAKRAKPSWWATLAFSCSISRVFPFCAVYEPFGKLTIRKWAELCLSAVQCPERFGMNVFIEGFNQETHGTKTVVA